VDDFVVGALVRWPNGPGQPYGIVQEIDGRRITVLFEGAEGPQIFRAESAGIERVRFTGLVRRVSTNDIGPVQAIAAMSPPRWQVYLDNQLVTVPEADLRPHIMSDPLSKVRDGRLGSARQFGLAITAHRYAIEHLAGDLVALGEARVDIKPHQVSVVHRVITDYPHRYLLCDEVGLGKTIEAGMVMKELRARGGAGRSIIIAPPNLLRQWQFELKTKFNEVFSVINSDTVKYLRNTQRHDGNPFVEYDSVLVSDRWITGKDSKTGKTWAQLAAACDWDLVIVDEAHHARVQRVGRERRENLLYKAVRSLVAPESFSQRAALLLTATPMQLNSTELYALVELLDPALFPTEEHFDRHRNEVPGLSRLVHDLTEHGFPIPAEQDDSVIERVSTWLDLDPAEAAARLSGGPDAIAALCDDLTGRHLLSQVLIRNRKKVIGGFMPRHATRWEVTLSESERRALDAVEAYVRSGYERASDMKDRSTGFVMTIFQKMTASSIRAIRTSLDGRRIRLEAAADNPRVAKATKKLLPDFDALVDDDDYVTAVLAEVGEASRAEADELGELVALLDAVTTDSKADTFIEQLRALEGLDPHAKVLLFTEFRETQDYLRQRCEVLGWDVQVFHGQMKAEAKDSAVEAFRNARGPSILLSTEAGGEGRNFQFCHILVNYDLPWNPMRVEQRIGRVDRIGQQHTVQVFNFWIKDTVEERVLDMLEHRIQVFEETVGGLDPILGDAENDITRIMKLAGEKRDIELAKYEQQLERRLANARRAEERLRDFIMETRSYSKEIVSLVEGAQPTIDESAQELFTKQLLADVRTYLQSKPDGSYEISFNEPFSSDYPQHTREGLRKRTVTFRSGLHRDSEHVEYFGFGHPVVRDLMLRSMSEQFAGSASSFRVPPSENPAGPGWLIAHQVHVPGLDELNELSAWFVPDGGEPDAVTAIALMDRAARFIKDERAPVSDLALEQLVTAYEASQVQAFAVSERLETEARAAASRRIDSERRKIIGFFDYRDQAARGRLADSEATLARFEASADDGEQRIIPIWQARVERDRDLIARLVSEREARLADLEQRAVGRGDVRCVALARIEA